jgi:hypothetical protein
MFYFFTCLIESLFDECYFILTNLIMVLCESTTNVFDELNHYSYVLFIYVFNWKVFDDSYFISGNQIMIKCDVFTPDHNWIARDKLVVFKRLPINHVNK